MVSEEIQFQWSLIQNLTKSFFEVHKSLTNLNKDHFHSHCTSLLHHKLVPGVLEYLDYSNSIPGPN